MDGSLVESVLPRDQWERVDRDEAIRLGFVDLVFADGRYAHDKRLCNFRCKVKNRIDAKLLTNKVDLHQLLQREIPGRWICETQLVSASTKISDDQVWIWRPEGAFGGEGNVTLTSQRQLEDARQEHSREPRTGRAIISRDIDSPLLMEGRKFHLRIHLLVLLTEDRFRSYVFRDGLIIKVVSAHVNSHFGDKGVHDTHMTNCSGDYRFPRDFPGGPEVASGVFDQICACLTDVARATASGMEIHEEAEAGFELFGCDFVVTAQGKVRLLEVKFNPSFKRDSTSELRWLTQTIANGVQANVIGQLFGGQAAAPASANITVPLYSCPRGTAAVHDGSLSYLAPFEYLGLNLHCFDEALPASSWQKVSTKEALAAGSVDLMLVDGMAAGEKGLYSIRCRLKSRINASVISNKVKLHVLLSAQAPDLICETVVVDRGTTIRPGEVWIWRPEGGYAGASVEVVTSQGQLSQLQRRPLRGRALLSRYIADPALMDGCKFHLRIHLCVLVTEEAASFRVFREGLIIRAMEPYKSAGYGDKNIHDTHMSLSPGDYRFPRDYPGGAEAAGPVFDQVVAHLSTVGQLTGRSVHKYDECEAGFELFGCDFMVDAAGRVFLIEINMKPTMKRRTAEESRWLSRTTFEAVRDKVLAEVFQRDVVDNDGGSDTAPGPTVLAYRQRLW